MMMVLKQIKTLQQELVIHHLQGKKEDQERTGLNQAAKQR